MSWLARRRHRKCLERIARLERWADIHDAWVADEWDRPTAVAKADAGKERKPSWPERIGAVPEKINWLEDTAFEPGARWLVPGTNYVQILSTHGLMKSGLARELATSTCHEDDEGAPKGPLSA